VGYEPAPWTGPRFVEVTGPSLTTDSDSFVDVPGGSITFTPSSVEEVWLVLTSAQMLSTSTLQGAVEVRQRVDGGERNLASGQNESPDNPLPYFDVDLIRGATGAVTADVQLRARQGTATIRNLRIVAFPLPAGADAEMADAPGAVNVPPDVPTPLATLAFSPSSPGEYLVLAKLNGSEGPGDVNIRVQFLEGTSELGAISNNRSTFAPMLFVQRLSVGPASPPLTLQASGGTMEGATARDARIIAFRLDAFEAAESVEQREWITADSGAVLSTLTTRAPPTTRDYITIQNLRVHSPESDPDATRGRVSEFRRDSEVLTSYVRYNSSSSSIGSDAVFTAVSTDASSEWENAISSNNPAFRVAGTDSVIHALRLAPE